MKLKLFRKKIKEDSRPFGEMAKEYMEQCDEVHSEKEKKKVEAEIKKARKKFIEKFNIEPDKVTQDGILMKEGFTFKPHRMLDGTCGSYEIKLLETFIGYASDLYEFGKLLKNWQEGVEVPIQKPSAGTIAYPPTAYPSTPLPIPTGISAEIAQRQMRATQFHVFQKIIDKFKKEHPDFDEYRPEMLEILWEHPEMEHDPNALEVVYEKAKARRKQHMALAY